MCLLWGTMRTVQQWAIESTTDSPVWKFLPQIWQLEQGFNHLLDLCHSSILNCWLFTKILLKWKKKETIRKRKTIHNSQQNYIGIFESVKTGCDFLPLPSYSHRQRFFHFVLALQLFFFFSQVIFRGEKGKGRTGDIGLDDVILRRGRCSEEH